MAEKGFKINTDIGEAYAGELKEAEVIAAAWAALESEGLLGTEIELSVAVSDDEEVQRLNRQFRGTDQTTDVLSFSAEEEPDWGAQPLLSFPNQAEQEQEELRDEAEDEEDSLEEDPLPVFKLPPGFGMQDENSPRYLGDIIISYPQAERQAPEFNNSTPREAQELIIHGVFHLLGYDHEDPQEREIMRAKEEAAGQILDGKML